MAANRQLEEPRRRWWPLKLLAAIVVVLAAASFIPGRFIPAVATPAFEKLVAARRWLAGAVTDSLNRTDGDRRPGTGPAPVAPPAEEDAPGPGRVAICSFTIPRLGGERSRDHRTLAALVQRYDIVTVQGIIAPPFPMRYPDGAGARPSPLTAAFFEAMRDFGFHYALSDEDTGPGERLHRNDDSTQWWVAFFKPNTVAVATDLPAGFLASRRAANPSYDRVPWAFPFRTLDGKLDFVLISTDLAGGTGAVSRARRTHELHAIENWIERRCEEGRERDFIVLGNMNFTDAGDMLASVPSSLKSLNEDCRSTMLDPARREPRDHVLYRPQATREVDARFGLHCVNPLSALSGVLTADRVEQAGQRLSTHRPVVFRLSIPARDDD
jgi:hypothetical protein